MTERIDLFDDGHDAFSPAALRAASSAVEAEPVDLALAGARVLSLEVVGTPRPQGSKKAFVSPKTGRAFVVDDNPEKLRTWRSDVLLACRAALKGRDEFPLAPNLAVAISIAFLLPRPKGHWRTGRFAHLLRADAPARPATKPDVDKLSRSTLDALRDAGAYVDDSQVVELKAKKVWATDAAGAVLTIVW